MASRLSAGARPLLRNAASREGECLFPRLPEDRILTYHMLLPASCSRRQAASSSQQVLLFSTSARAEESRRKRIARIKRQANLEQRQLKETLLERSKPDPILGHQLNDEGKAIWDVSELRQIILAKDDVWSGKVAEAAVAETGAEETKPGPAQLNFGLSEKDRELLFQDLPDIMVEDRLLDSPEASRSNPNDLQAISKDMEAYIAEEQQNVETLSRILDLRNASGKGIQVENTRRVIDAFGGGRDTGSSEVQGE